MNSTKILKDLADNLADKIKVKGVLSVFKVAIIHGALKFGYDTLHRKHPGVAYEFCDLAERYLDKDVAGMVDEAADLLAAIIKLLFVKGR